MADTLTVVERPWDELKPHPRNPRNGDIDAIADSLRRNGQYRPIVTTSDGTILAGNHTYMAAGQLGYKSLSAVVLPIEPDGDAALRIMLADNRTADLGGYDDGLLLSALLQLDRETSERLDGTGYDDAALKRLLVNDQSWDLPESGATVPPFTSDQVADAAAASAGSRPFPIPPVNVGAAMFDVNALAQMPNEDLRGTHVGHTALDGYHPHRYGISVHVKTVLEVWEDDALRRHAALLALNHGSQPSDDNIARMARYTRGAQLAAQFRPGFALWYARQYAPNNGSWLDCSAGFGGRMLAFHASHLARYVGIDPSAPTVAGNRQAADDLAVPGKTVELVEKPAEDVTADELDGPFDFAFTSPPYFAKEKYVDSGDSTQSWKRYPNAEDWRDGFLRPLLALQYEALRPGAWNIVNIADVKMKNTTVPLVEWTEQAADAAGFDYERKDEYELPRVPGRGDRPQTYEPVLCFRKPER